MDWQTYRSPLTANVLQAAELILGVRFPARYAELATAYPGGRPLPNEFEVNTKKGSWGSCLGVLLSLDPRDSENVFQCIGNTTREGGLPEGLIPIADDGGGDLICLDFRSAHGEPPVVYWAHELGGVDGLVPVAETFEEFLGRLKDDEE
jgi:hypothetical protein